MPTNVTIRTMTLADIPLAMRLKSLARWNQTTGDLKRFLTLSPEGCFVASVNGNDVGTAATFIFANVSWIAMILVDPAVRGQGVGSAMMKHCLAYLNKQGVTSIRLDATDLGKPVYDKLGFVDQFKLVRYQGSLPTNEPDPDNQGCDITSFSSADLNELITLDKDVTETDRATLLTLLTKEAWHDFHAQVWIAREAGVLTGYCMSRPGANALFIGPCLATIEHAGRALLDTAAQFHAGQRVLIDIPSTHAPAMAWAKGKFLTEQRQFTRMCKGIAISEQIDQLWASSGPAKG